MTYWGTMSGGGQMLLGDPAEAVLSYDRNAPADQLKAVFPAERIWEELTEVAVYDGGQGIFRGIVDEQNTRLTPEGLFVELICRSREALLLDNEAEPVSIRRPSLEGIRRRILEPLGFDAITGPAGSVPGELTVKKGTSCWEVLDGFCGEYFGTRPYVDFEGVLHCEGVEERLLEAGSVLRAELNARPCKRLSAVWKQGYRGGYDTLFSDPDCPVVRRRYVSAQSGKNPRELLEEGKRASFLLTVVCGEALWPLRGAKVSVSVPLARRFIGCGVRRGVYFRNQNGESTRLILDRETGEGDGSCG